MNALLEWGNQRHPLNTRRFNVYKTPIQRRRRRIDVLQKLKRRVSAGQKRI